MKKLFSALMMAVFMMAASSSFAAGTVDLKDPYKMVNEVASTSFAKLKANKDKLSDVNFRKELVRTELLPYVDTNYAGAKVLGSLYKSTNAEDRKAFLNAFSEYIVSSFADALALYNNQDLVSETTDKPVSADATQVVAKFLIRESGKKDLELLFKLRKNSKTGEWKVFDMVSEGISMLDAKTSELQPLLRSKGVKAVTDLIVKHNESGSKDPVK